MFQVEILLRELCRLHTVSLPPDLDNLTMSLQMPAGEMLVCNDYSNDIDSDQEEEAANESEQDSENDEDLPLEMDDGRNISKVGRTTTTCSSAENDFFFFFKQKEDMDVEHLATLERFRQSHRQEHLKVNSRLTPKRIGTKTKKIDFSPSRALFPVQFKQPIAL